MYSGSLSQWSASAFVLLRSEAVLPEIGEDGLSDDLGEVLRVSWSHYEPNTLRFQTAHI